MALRFCLSQSDKPDFPCGSEGWAYPKVPPHHTGDLPMIKSIFTRLIFVAGIALPVCCFNASAQEVIETVTPESSVAMVPAASPAVSGPEMARSFRERELGWVCGRVFVVKPADDATQTSSSEALSGVKILLRSTDTGYSSFLREQFTNDDGTYDFDAIGAGNYTVEIDPQSLPAKFRPVPGEAKPVQVKALDRTFVELPVTAKRNIVGTIYIDKDGNGQFTPGKDVPAAGYMITADGSLAVSDANGAYTLKDLPPGRVGLLIQNPATTQSTHMVFDLNEGPVTDRVINIPVSR
jgi:hypothetical protein